MATLSLMRLSPSFPPRLLSTNGGIRTSSTPPTFVSFKKLSSSQSLSGFPLILNRNLSSSTTPAQNPPSMVVVAAKGYKMKTHKASAKRFRVTGTGKIVRRRAGKQHLLAKKNNKRKLRLSKMHAVNRSDYDNVIGALPYLKVNRNSQ
ncbi:hypothetical protein QJS04_geneDACA003878 [Acorus gramineus]|uniref:50S ribosomal protein L35 n=1 Tax=Acorus gramineus TaxID=55184 RepID=A0AAV9BDC7_ACOGR|nr:hypothetical protein QJS04_geneDACA003878 [Acorus gramineus]